MNKGMNKRSQQNEKTMKEQRVVRKQNIKSREEGNWIRKDKDKEIFHL
jgi:hypothetical protein